MNAWQCLLCNDQTQPVQVAPVVRDSPTHRVVQCRACSHVQLCPVPTATALLAFYQAETQRNAIHGHMTRDMKRMHVQADTARRVALIRALVQTSMPAVLDVGSGQGFVAEALRETYQEVQGVDIGERLPDERYDVVSAFHVVEHVPTCKAFLQSMWRRVDEHGALVLEVPNHADAMLTQNTAYRAWHYQQAHIHYFSPQTLLAIVKMSGLAYHRCDLFGVQRYSLDAAHYWQTHHNAPMAWPVGWSHLEGKDEAQYRALREGTFTSDTLCLILKK